MGDVGQTITNAIDKTFRETSDLLTGEGKRREDAYQKGQQVKAEAEQKAAEDAIKLQEDKASAAKDRTSAVNEQKRKSRKKSGRSGTILTSNLDTLGDVPAEDTPVKTILGG